MIVDGEELVGWKAVPCSPALCYADHSGNCILHMRHGDLVATSSDWAMSQGMPDLEEPSLCS